MSKTTSIVNRFFWTSFSTGAVVMITNPPEIITSNLGKWLIFFGVNQESIPEWIHAEVFHNCLLFVAITILCYSIINLLIQVIKKPNFKITKKTSLRTQKSLIIKSIMMDLEYSIPRYKNFYEKYNFNEPSVNMIFYVDELLEIMQLLTHSNKSNTLLDIETLFSYPEAHKINQYYNKSRNLISWLKLAKKVMSISIEDDEFIKSYKLLNIPHQKQQSDTKDLITVDPIVDYKIYMQNFYIPEIKKLKNTAEQLIQMLNSKHTT
jgi:hypothetical protein